MRYTFLIILGAVFIFGGIVVSYLLDEMKPIVIGVVIGIPILLIGCFYQSRIETARQKDKDEAFIAECRSNLNEYADVGWCYELLNKLNEKED